MFILLTACGGLYNLSAYFFGVFLPLVAVDLGAEPKDLGFIQAIYAGTYTVFAFACGLFLVDRAPASILCRFSVITFYTACCGMILADKFELFWIIYASVVIGGLGDAIFWSPIQAAVGLDAQRLGKPVSKRIAMFSICWSVGKSIGLVSGGFLKGLLGILWSYVSIAGVDTLILLLMPIKDEHCCIHQLRYRKRSEDTAGTGAPTAEDTKVQQEEAEKNARFLPMSWVMNFVTLGTTATVANQYFKLIQAESIELHIIPDADPKEAFLGTFLFCVYIAQSAVFLVFSFTQRWKHKRLLMYCTQLAIISSCLIISLVYLAPVLLCIAVVLGASAGIAYQTSLAYSITAKRDEKGKFLGVHEAIIGSSAAVFPLITGLLSSMLDELRVPYWFCACAQFIAIGAEESVYQIKSHGGIKTCIRKLASSTRPCWKLCTCLKCCGSMDNLWVQMDESTPPASAETAPTPTNNHTTSSHTSPINSDDI
ncbi:transporter, major facilitator family protein [Pelomyxa schiedti]|nr:transporter, major facilitator family protein [Pelomyxa schiedti]